MKSSSAILVVVAIALVSCGGSQAVMTGGCPRTAANEPVDPLAALAAAYFQARGAFSTLEDVPRFGLLRMDSDQASALITGARHIAAQVIVAYRVLFLTDAEETAEELLLAMADLWRAIGAAEAATSGRDVGQVELEALSTTIDVAMVVTEDLHDVLDEVVSDRLARGQPGGEDLRCLRARYRAFEQWARYVDLLEEESFNLSEEARIIEESDGDDELAEELEEQRRLLAEHRVVSRRALTILANSDSSLDRIGRDLEGLEALEWQSLEDVTSAFQTARETCP